MLALMSEYLASPSALPLSRCCRNCLKVYARGSFANLAMPSTAVATADSIRVESDSGFHGPDLAIDQVLNTWFGSASSYDHAWLQIDLGSAAPYFDQLGSITVRPHHRPPCPPPPFPVATGPS